MLHINYLVVNATRPLKLSAIMLSADSLVPDILDIVHKRNKPFALGSDWLEAYHINIPLTAELERLLDIEWTYETLAAYCTEDRRMKNHTRVKDYITEGAGILHVVVMAPEI